MERRISSQWRRASWLSLFALGLSAHAQGEWVRHFRIGASAAFNIKTDFTTSGAFPVSGSNPGPAVAGINHEYDDGYVRVDALGNAAPPGGVTQTTYWAYNDAAQFDAGAQTLTYHGTRSFTATGFTSEDDSPQLGFDMVYGGTIPKWDRVAIGLEFGFGLNLMGPTDRTPFATTLTRARHRYSTAGITAFPPPGTPGNPSGVGSPALPDTPTDLGDETLAGTVTGSRKLDAILYTLRLGPLVRWEMFPRWTLNGSAGGMFGMLDAEYIFDENIAVGATNTRNSGQFGAAEFTYGAYAGAVLMYDTGNFWEVYLGAHFASLSDTSVSNGGRSAEVNLNAALFVTAGINWSF